MRVKLTALVGDNTTSGLEVDASYSVHSGPDDQGRVWVFDDVCDSFRAVTRGEYREVPDPLEPHDLLHITHQPDGWSAVCTCVWRDTIPAADPDAATHSYNRHLGHMERARYHLTAWTDPQLLQALEERRTQHQRRQDPER